MTFILIRFYHKSHIFSDLRNLSPAYIFLAATILGYCGALLLSDSFFDRYNLPVITLVLMILGARLPGVNYGSVAGIAALFILVLSAYASIAGTRDYFEVNRTRWAAYYDLRKDDKISARSINGGFEVNCWNEGQPGWWANVLTTEYYDYMIQYTAAPGFLPLKKYPFKRIFPLRSDTLTVSKKITPPGT